MSVTEYKNNGGGYVQGIAHDDSNNTGIIKFNIHRDSNSITDIIKLFNLTSDMMAGVKAEATDGQLTAKNPGPHINYIGKLGDVIEILNDMEGFTEPALQGQPQWINKTEFELAADSSPSIGR